MHTKRSSLVARKLRIGGFVLSVLLAGIGVTCWSVYRATQSVRPFYAEALKPSRELAELERASRELETQAAALYSATQHKGSWSATFTADQLNAWLALQSAASDDDPHLLPPSVRDPRIAIEPDQLTIGFRSEQAGLETVISVDARVFLTEPNVIGIRLESVRAGALPLPVTGVAKKLQEVSQGWRRPVRWTQFDGDVVALVDVAPHDGEALVIDTLELHAGEIYVAGTTRAQAHDSEQLSPKEIELTTESDFPSDWPGSSQWSRAEIFFDLGEIGVRTEPAEVAKRRQRRQSGVHSNLQ